MAFIPPKAIAAFSSTTDINGPGTQTVTTAIDTDGNIYLYRPINNTSGQVANYGWVQLPPIENKQSGVAVAVTIDPLWIYS